MQISIRFGLSALALAMSFAASAGDAPVAGKQAPKAAAAVGAVSAVSAQEAERLIGLLDRKTGMKATAVAPAPIPNFYEMTVGVNLYYMDKAGKYLLDGHLVDLDTRTSLTALKKQALEKVGLPSLDWRTLNLADAIKTVRGRTVPGRVLVTFEDPNCGFCKRLHPELEKMQDLTVYTLPISILGPDSQAKNEALWCTKDKSASWAALMNGQPVKADGACDTSAILRNGELAHKLKVSGTPTMFLADGSRIPGFMDAAAIEARLAALQK